jgi:hypothetical protein
MKLIKLTIQLEDISDGHKSDAREVHGQIPLAESDLASFKQFMDQYVEPACAVVVRAWFEHVTDPAPAAPPAAPPSSADAPGPPPAMPKR